MSNQSNKNLVSEFMTEIWNKRHLNLLDDFLHESYRDDSLPDGFPPNQAGLRSWIQSNSQSFDHLTAIESMVAEDDMVAIRISFQVKHIGLWRGLSPSGRSAKVKGFRFFRLGDGKIIQHWAMIDGNALHAQLSKPLQVDEMVK